MFFDARRKIDRADKHIGDIKSEVLALESDYVSSVEADPQGRGNSIKYECPGFQRRLIDIALVTGDAIHNLRTALDYAWIGTINALNLPPTRWTKFPFAHDPQALNAALLERQIDRACPALFKKIVTEVQPYKGGNPYLWALHDADITDKHKLLLPIIDYTGAGNISVEDETGTVHKGHLMPRQGSQGVIYVDFAPNVKIKDQGKISVSVFFHEGSALAGVPILEELSGLSWATSSVVHSLEIIAS